MIFTSMSFESQYATSYWSIAGHTSHRLATIARNGLQGFSTSIFILSYRAYGTFY